MIPVENISEDEMVAAFLRAEIESPRWSNHILSALNGNRLDRRIIESPNIADSSENAMRSNILGSYRGFHQNRLLFLDFPADVQWQRVVLVRSDLETIRFVRTKYWVQLTGGSLIAKDAAAKIAHNSVQGLDVSNILATREAVRSGRTIPEIILVAKSTSHEIVALEGNVRVTAYLLDLDTTEVPGILGRSLGFDAWFAKWQ